MYLADYHVHSSCSPDGSESMLQLACSAVEKGLQELCFTDHVDTRDWGSGAFREHDWNPAIQQFQQAQEALGDRIRLRLGAELGEVTQNIPLMERFLSAAPPLDFTIGSVHTADAAHQWKDLYYLDSRDPAENRQIIAGYLGEVKKLARWGRFQVLGHLTLPLRYMNEKLGLQMSFDGFEDALEEIFRIIIPQGIGMELNTNRGNAPLPGAKILRQYRELGGEVITLGSDAHGSAWLGCAIAQRQQLLRECGFRYFCTFTGGKPEFHSL